MGIKNLNSALAKPFLPALGDKSLPLAEGKRAETKGPAVASTGPTASPQALQKLENPHRPHPAAPPPATKTGRASPVDPAALLGEEPLIDSVDQLEDPHAQPELPVELMDYTPRALEYRYGYAAQGRLFGPRGTPHYSDVRVNLSKDGALGAALAAVAASSPAHITHLIGPARTQGLIRGILHSRSTAGGTYALQVDRQVPMRQDGAPMGHSAPPEGPVAIWHLLLAKMIAKLDQVLVQAQGTQLDPLGMPHAIADIAGFLETLSGTPVHTATRDPRGHDWSAALQILLNSTRPLAAAVTFRDTQSVGRMECDDGVLTNAFGGLGMHVQNPSTNVILLSKHHYAVVAVDRAQKRVQLYNPLGWNPDPETLHSGTRAAQFMAPDQLDALPKTQATFWVSNSLLARIGVTLSLCDLPA